MRAALVQLCSGDDPEANLGVTERLIRDAAAGGAELILTPEVTNCVSSSRARQRAVLRSEAEDPTLARLRVVAAELGVALVIGSLAVRTEDADGRFANRCFVIAPDGSIAARYDKIHMFDVDLDNGESYRESSGFRPGTRAVTARVAGTCLGLSICYDMRFAALYRVLAKAGAEVLTVPAAFTVPTGRAHWHTLLRARAIETGCFVLAPAQCGHHATTEGAERRTYGHSLAVSPWGEVLAEAGEAPGVTFVDLDLAEVSRARGRVPRSAMIAGSTPRTAVSGAPRDPMVVVFFSEIVMIEQLARGRLQRALPRGMELSHFMVLNHFARLGGEKTPAQLARVFHVTRGAMTNTLQKLDAAGYVHIRPDWDDARRKWIGISPAGQAARDRAVLAMAPVFDDLLAELGLERLLGALPTLRAIRAVLGTDDP